jgi:phosphatidylglycerol:prolipoprotein diacylglycerol transferase
MTLVIPFPDIDPVLFQFGPFALRWYALAFIAGLLMGWWYLRAYARLAPQRMTETDADDFLTWATLGVVLGGRLGYVGFYNLAYYADNPLAILKVWEGGMSFHGGLIGLFLAVLWFARRRAIPVLALGDAVATIGPIGLFFGRLANFVNGELYGRATDMPWAMVFPRGGPAPRHPSQLYEAALEGLVLFAILYFMSRMESVRRRPGLLTGVCLLGYSLARGSVELFREPDAHIGFLLGGMTMGQLLSAPVLVFGIYLVLRARLPS